MPHATCPHCGDVCLGSDVVVCEESLGGNLSWSYLFYCEFCGRNVSRAIRPAEGKRLLLAGASRTIWQNGRCTYFSRYDTPAPLAS